MGFTIFSSAGLMFLLRWFHLFFGVIWIGLLYYFNFIQGPFFAETDAATKSNAIQKLLPRALAWFRWAAMFTMITGLLIVGHRGHESGFQVYATSWGVLILTGVALGLAMWANVWFVIWPNQKVVIASAVQVASGGKAIPEAAACGARALVASRTNTMFSIPMLFFMGAASHLPLNVGPTASFTAWAVIFGVILSALELNAIKGKTGPMTSVKGVVHCGFALAVVLYVVMDLVLR